MTEWIIQDSRAPHMVSHPSAETALMAMQALAARRNFTRILDFGCGSGILTLAALELWPCATVTAVDISPLAVADCHSNITHYGHHQRVSVRRGDSLDHPNVTVAAPYDLIISNLLAELHFHGSSSLKSRLQPDGCCILAGILRWRMEQVMEALNLLSFEKKRRI